MAIKINMSELRKIFKKIYPTVEEVHMNVIAAILFRTDFKKVNSLMGIYYDFYDIKEIKQSCKELNKEL